jgi:hypothetical protein
MSPGGTLWALALDFEVIFLQILLGASRRKYMLSRVFDCLQGTQRHLRNDGGSLFSLGNKMGEIQGLPTLYAAGGRTELLGGVFNGGMDTGYPTVRTSALWSDSINATMALPQLHSFYRRV